MEQNPFAQNQFASVPREILLAPDLSLAAKGLYGILCAMPQLDEPVNFAMLEEQFPAPQLEAAWEEMILYLEKLEYRRKLQEAMEELAAAQPKE